MKLILENLDISDELKSELSEAFDKKVNKELILIAEAKEKEYEEYMYAQLQKINESHTKNIDAYLDRVIESFFKENEFKIDASIDKAKQDAILEGFNALTIATGVEIAQIAESKEIADNSLLNESKSNELELKSINDSLMKEIIELKESNNKLMSMGIIAESSKNMTYLQEKRFIKLAETVEYDELNPSDYLKKIDAIVEVVMSSDSNFNESTRNSSTRRTPNAHDSKINESKTKITEKYVSKASHLY